ncbi:MAG: hypothetical protein WCJ61_06110 [Paludibacter sp.]
MKKLLILIVPVLFLFSCTKEPGEIQGVVTYLFNDNVGYKPDIGAEIYVTNINCDTITQYYKALELNNKVESDIANIQSWKNNIPKYQEDLKKYKANLNYDVKFWGGCIKESLQGIKETEFYIKDGQNKLTKSRAKLFSIYKNEEGYKKFITAAKKFITKIKTSKETYIAQVDVSGKYSITQIKPDDYTVIIFSSRVTDKSFPEIKKVQIDSKKTIIVNARFK